MLDALLDLVVGFADDGQMWTLAEREAVDGVEGVASGAGPYEGAVYALILAFRPPELAVEGVVPAHGCDPRAGGHGRYWVTGTVGKDVRYLKHDPQVGGPSYRFLLKVGSLGFVGKVVASRRRVKADLGRDLSPGHRVTVDCVFAIPHQEDWEADELPKQWRSTWQILGDATGGDLGYMLDLEPPADHDKAPTAGDGRRTPLLLYTDYGGGPLWYRSTDNKASWGIELSDLPLSENLHGRLVRWTAGDYHLHYDYEDDDPAHEVAWDKEALALLAELRSELGPEYDIKYAHDLNS